MHAQYGTPVRRRSSYNVIPAGPEDAPSHGSLFLKSICSTLGGWMQDQPEQAAAELDASMDSDATGEAHSLVQVLEGMGTWALQAAALNICLPSSGWLKPGQISRCSSRCDSLSSASCHPMHPPSNPSSRSSSERDLAVGAADRDTRKPAGQPDYCKTPLSHGSTAQQFTPTAAAPVSASAASAADDSSSRIAELIAKNARLQCELTCSRTCVGALYITCSTLKEENKRLRLAADAAGEDLLSDALEQLLGEKNALQQEVAKLKQHNKALQELLEFTAPAAAPSASEGLPWAHGACYGSSSTSLLEMSAPIAPAAHCDDDSHSMVQTGVINMPVMQQVAGSCVQQRMVEGSLECCDYWLATPAGAQQVVMAQQGR